VTPPPARPGTPVVPATPVAPDARRWVATGTALCLTALGELDESSWAEPSELPGWSRKHVGAHLAANAEALRNLARWAATGEPTPMYASPEARAAGIDQGALLPRGELLAWVRESAAALEADWDRLSEAQWAVEVLTAQGRTVSTAQTPWMRAREVAIHAVDLGSGVGFADLPEDFLAALCVEVRARRELAELPAQVAEAPLPEVAAWLTGRPHHLTDAPDLGPWL
jgi:maleylpyruvate isomerase